MCQPGGSGPASEPDQPSAHKGPLSAGRSSRAIRPCAGEVASAPPEGCALCPHVVPVELSTYLLVVTQSGGGSRASLESQVNKLQEESERPAYRGTPRSLEGAG